MPETQTGMVCFGLTAVKRQRKVGITNSIWEVAMKKAFILVGLGVLACAGVAQADQDIGCGWGTMLWKGQEGVPQKVMGATTNGSFGSQTFGISSQTAGCKREGTIKVEARVRMFAGANVDHLARDM